MSTAICDDQIPRDRRIKSPGVSPTQASVGGGKYLQRGTGNLFHNYFFSDPAEQDFGEELIPHALSQ